MAHDPVAAVTYLQTQAALITGMRSAPANPTDNRPAFPACMSFVQGVAVDVTMTRFDQYTIETQIHVARVDLARSVASLSAFYELFLDVLYAGNKNLNGNVSTVKSATGTMLFDTQWGGIETISLVFRTEVKV